MTKPLFILTLLIFSSIVYGEKFDLEVYASKFDSIPVGVIDFRSSNGKKISETDLQPWKIIASDLDFCGKFSVTSLGDYDSAAFAAASVGIYIDGEYTVEGSQVAVNCYLRDAATRELIIGKKYKGELKSMRAISHRYSNEIVEMLFGDRGIFLSRILYINSSGNKKSVAIMDFDGYNSVTLTKNDVINIFPAFMDTKNILWISYLRGKPDMYKGSITDGTSKIHVYSKAITTSPDVSPIDGTIAYGSSIKGNLDIFTCNPDGTNVRQLTVHYGVDTSPSWSPNGYQIAFTSDRSGNPQVYIMDADGANQRRLTFESKYTDSPAWSPKGDKIAFMSMNENGRFDIWTIAPDGTGLTRVTDIGGNNEYPSWSPDGTLIGFVNTTGGRSDLYTVKHDGTRVRRVTNSGNVKMPDWSDF
ncbi:MAG TPA: hypothetical protein VHP36_02790 [Chitinispirillaceae bacterium]|nr:hypothetical protein [Chitinispirillaceae bacterium]